jgi:hypothetical protein
MAKKKNKLQNLEDSLSEAINPKPKIDRQAAASSLLGVYRSESVVVPSPKIIEDKPSAPRAVSAPSARTKYPIAPEKDFTRVANSIVRQIPNGAFVGKSKQMYDYLYSITRGAIKPSRTIRVSKSVLMKGSGIKSTHTFYNNVRHLEEIGLIAITRIDGEKSGNQFEVLLPEEITNPDHLAHLTQLAQAAQLTALAQKLPVAPSAETALTALGSEPVNNGTATTLNTSLKTNTTDDDAFVDFQLKLNEVAKELTGKNLSKRDSGNLSKIADLLILELKIAARRTDSISSASAFLAEVLRRKLRDTVPVKVSKSKTDTIGKPDGETYEIKALDEKGREAALTELTEFKDDEFFADFEKYYTSEDWKWITEQLKK